MTNLKNGFQDAVARTPKSYTRGQIAGLILGLAVFGLIAFDLVGFGLNHSARLAAAVIGIGTLIGTPPNAIVFGSGRVKMGEMVRAGLVLNVLVALIVSTFLYFVLLPAWGMAPAVPTWAG